MVMQGGSTSSKADHIACQLAAVREMHNEDDCVLALQELTTLFVEPRSLVSSSVNNSLKNSWPSCRDAEGQNVSLLHLPAWLHTRPT